MKIYNKLVRDKIPQIISADGKVCRTRIVKDGGEIIKLLEAKFLEEWQEYQTSQAPEEIADLLEVLFALGKRYGITEDALLSLREEKAKERGSFDEGIFLESVSDR